MSDVFLVTDANDREEGGRPVLDPADKESSTIGVRAMRSSGALSDPEGRSHSV